MTEIRALEASQAASRQRMEALFQYLLHRSFNGELCHGVFPPFHPSAFILHPFPRMTTGPNRKEVRREQFRDGSALVTYEDGSMLILESNLAKEAVGRE